MKSTNRSRTFAPSLNALENRALLSGMGQAMATEVLVTEKPIFNKMMTSVESVRITTEVEALPMAGMMMGKPTGKVTVDMVMPAGMTMPGMKAGTTKLGRANLHNGTATFTIKAKDVVEMPLQVIYNGSKTFASSTTTPPVQTETELLSQMSMNMGGMSMARK